MKLTLTAHQYYADLTLTNVSDKDVNNVIIDIDKYAELNDASTIIVKYPSGLIEKIEWEDEQHTTLKRTVYLPVNMTSDADIFSLRTLKPGESIKGQLRYKNREIDD